MNVTATATVLAKIQAFDRRTAGDSEILVWHEAIGDLDAADCLEAVTAHYRDSTDWLTPAHIRRHAATAARRRAGQQRQAQLAQLTTPDGEPLAVPAGVDAASGAEPAPAVKDMIRQVINALPSTEPDVHQRARARARRERGRPDPALTQRRDRKDRAKAPKDYPKPAGDEIAKLATRYLLDGHDPADVAERLAVSRKWCQRTIRKFSNGRANPTEE